HRAVDPDLPGLRLLEPGDGPERGGLAAARRPEQREMLAGPDGERDPADGGHAAVAHHEVAHLDRRAGRGARPAEPAHSPGCCTARRAAAKRRIRARATASVCSRAMAAVSSVLVENHDSTMAGVMTLARGPIRRIDAPSSRTLAMNSRSHAATSPGRSSGMVTVRIR